MAGERESMGGFVRSDLNLTAAGAQLVVAAAETKASSLGVAVSIVVVDSAGDILAALRMDGAPPMSFAPAQIKARTSARMGRSSRRLPDGLGERLALASPEEFTELRGGIPLRVEDQVAGAVGVGGATPDQDVEVAEAGCSALTA